MSGGTFDYDQYKITDIADTIEEILKEAAEGDVNDYYTQMPEDIKKALYDVMIDLRYSKVILDRLDYYLAGDDGEETYRERLAEELRELENTYKISGKI